jgi:GT2 family glycosyltransferase
MMGCTLAILMTCYNRRETTLRCLERLYAQKLPDGVSFSVFLVDDGCSDGTGVVVKAAHPDIQVIQGTGDLFWCNGMRLAWDHAAKEDPDFYLWLNDDVELLEGAIQRLLSCWLSVVGGAPDGRSSAASNQSSVLRAPSSDDLSKAVIVVGSTCDPVTGAHTYGGQRRHGKHPAKLEPVPPQDVPVECDTFQGNVVLVPRSVYQKIGNMHSFGHAMGDTDYGLRAKRAGCRVVVAPGFAGACGKNRQGDLSQVGFRKSWKVLMRRLPPADYLRFLKEHVGLRWLLYWWRPYMNLILSGIIRN